MLVYIYRPGAYVLSSRDSYIHIDGSNVTGISSAGYTYWLLPNGEYSISQVWPLDIVPDPKKVITKKGQMGGEGTYLYRIVVGGGPAAGLKRLLSNLRGSDANQ